MGIFHQIYKFRSSVILITAPILLLILFFITSPEIYKEIACAYTILLMAIYWVTEVVPLAVTALLPLVLYPLLGVVEARKVSIKYLKDVNVLFLGGLTVAIAVEHWNLHKRVALKVLTKVGAKPRWLLFGFMITTAFLSMWISNVATTAMMVPIAQAVLDELTSEQDKETSSDSGVGTPFDERENANRSQNQGYLAAEVQKKESHIRAEMGSYSNAKDFKNKREKSGGITLHNLPNGNVGGYHQVPSRESFAIENETNNPRIEVTEPDTSNTPPEPEEPHSKAHLDVHNLVEEGESPVSSTTELISNTDRAHQSKFVQTRSKKMQKGLAKALTISVCYAANIGGTATLTGTGPNLIMAGLFKETFVEAPEVDFGSWVVFALPGMLIFLLICWLWLQFLFLDLNWKEILLCCKRKNSNRTAEEKRTEEVIQRQYKELGEMSFAEIWVLIFFIILASLWLTRDPGFVSGWGSLPIFQSGYITDATVAMFIAFILFVFPSKRPNFLYCRSKRSNESGPVPPLLTWKIVQHKMAWNVILLLGGGFAMAYGSEVSGLSELIGEKMKPLKLLTPFSANFICCLTICLMTQCTSNTATATVFLPILAELAKILGVNPLLLMLPSTVITSYAFMLPVSTPPNAIAYSYGHLTMMDMIKAGSLMNVIGIFIALFSAYTFGGIGLNVFEACPSWVHSTYCNNSRNILNTTAMTITNTTYILS